MSFPVNPHNVRPHGSLPTLGRCRRAARRTGGGAHRPCYDALIWTRLALFAISGGLGSATVSTPLLNEALTLSSTTYSAGRDRANQAADRNRQAVGTEGQSRSCP